MVSYPLNSDRKIQIPDPVSGTPTARLNAIAKGARAMKLNPNSR